MENPALGGASGSLLGGDTRNHTVSPPNLQDTLERALRHEWTAETLGALLALRYPQPHLILMGAGSLHGLDPENRHRLIEAAQIDFYSDDAAEREAERQRRRWAEHCRRTWRPRR